MALKTLLDDAMETGFNELDKMEKGTDRYKDTVKPLNDMADRYIEIEKFNLEERKQKFEEEFRLKQLKQDQIDRYLKHGLTAVSVIG